MLIDREVGVSRRWHNVSMIHLAIGTESAAIDNEVRHYAWTSIVCISCGYWNWLNGQRSESTGPSWCGGRGRAGPLMSLRLLRCAALYLCSLRLLWPGMGSRRGI